MNLNPGSEIFLRFFNPCLSRKSVFGKFLKYFGWFKGQAHTLFQVLFFQFQFRIPFFEWSGTTIFYRKMTKIADFARKNIQ